MSTFMIFAIVLTLAYALYYVALITIDLTAKSKSDVAKEEVISAADNQEEEYAPRNVIENAETGGFSFVDNEAQPEVSQDAIDEAIEETAETTTEVPSEEQASEPTIPADEQLEDDVQEVKLTADEETEPTDTISEETSEDTSGELDAPTEEIHDEDEPSEAITDEEELPNLSTVNYEEQKEEEPQDNEPFDESKVFDPELSQPKYGVATIVEPEYSDELVSHANDVNEALSSIQVRDNGCDQFVLAEYIRNDKLAKDKNIETEDEVTRY